MARPSPTANFPGRSRLVVGGRPAFDCIQLCRANQKLALAPMDGLGYGPRRVVRCVPFPRCSENQGAVEMKRISIAGLFLAAVFALSAMAASSASAAELLARIAGGGSVAGVTFLSSATLPLLITHDGSLIHCKDAINHGLFLSSTLGNILIRFLGCSTAVGTSSFPCNTSGAGSGEIHLPLSTLFHLGLAHLTINVGRIPALAILLGKIIELECSIVKIEVKGSVIGALQRNGQPVPLNTPFTDVNLNFQQTANGLQHLRLFLMPGTTGLTTYDLETNIAGGGFELSSEVANALLDGFTLPNGKEDAIELVEP
jgi:hypothetical protein